MAILLADGYERPNGSRGTLQDIAGEKRLRLFLDTAGALVNNWAYWLQGMDRDLLPEFPAQALIHVNPDAAEVVDWKTHWRSCGGRPFGERMVALKWDPVWLKISAFGLPFPDPTTKFAAALQRFGSGPAALQPFL